MGPPTSIRRWILFLLSVNKSSSFPHTTLAVYLIYECLDNGKSIYWPPFSNCLMLVQICSRFHLRLKLSFVEIHWLLDPILWLHHQRRKKTILFHHKPNCKQLLHGPAKLPVILDVNIGTYYVWLSILQNFVYKKTFSVANFVDFLKETELVTLLDDD